jgi:hypothetical protein
MAYGSFPITQFGGLRLAEPDEVGPGQAVDLVNVDIDRDGALRSRDGYSTWSATAGSGRFLSLASFDVRDSYNHLIGNDGFNFRAYNQSGALLATQSAPATPGSYVRVGTSSASRLYCVGGTSTYYWNGSAFTTSTAPAGQQGGLHQPDNRLVIANLSADSSRVAFSDPGAPETFGASNYVSITPGDGSGILGMASFENKLFVFKRDRFAFFYGTSTDSAGNPVFNYSMVEGKGLWTPSALAVASEGVYFLARDGVYLTSGGRAQKVSQALDPYFRGQTLFAFTRSSPSPPSTARQSLAVHEDKLIVSLECANGSEQNTFVYDRRRQEWLYWDTAMVGVTSWAGYTNDRGPSRLFFGRLGVNHIYKLDPTLTTDNGAAIGSRFRSGFYTVGNQPSQEAVVRETVIDGSGMLRFSLARDFGAAPTSGGGARDTVTLGSTLAQARHRKAQRGRRFSYQIEDSSGSAWRIESLNQHVLSHRTPGLVTA